MSRFFAAGSSSDEESDHEGSEDEMQVPSRFATTGSGSESEPEVEEKRVVKSTKERRLEEFNQIYDKINSSGKKNNWESLAEEYDKLKKHLQKSKAAISEVPRVFIKSLVALEDFAKATKANKPKLNQANNKKFNTLSNTLKKDNKQYEDMINKYRQNPDAEEASDAEEEEEVVVESEEEEEPITPVVPQRAKGSDDEEGSDEEESDDDFETVGKGGKTSKWFTESKSKTADKEEDRRPRTDRPAGEKKTKKKEEEEQKKPTEMTEEQIRAKIKEILLQRGRKATDTEKQNAKFQELLPFAKTPNVSVEILLHIVSNHFDAAKNANTPLPISSWKAALESTKTIVEQLEANPSLVLSETEVEPKETQSSAEGDDEEEEVTLVSGNLAAFVERLADEFIKSLQPLDIHNKDYGARLQDEVALLQIAERVQQYYERIGKLRAAARIAERRIEHLYYRLEAPTATSDASTTESNNNTQQVPTGVLIDKLAQLVYAHGDERLKIRTMLCTIYFKSLSDQFFEARDMMLMSHLQDNINHTDILTQILFNRSMVQLGLSAFRAGLIKQAHSCLSEICAGGKVKELLAQGANTRYTDRDPKREKEERKRLLPAHMHINQDLLDAVHYVCAMLLEVPNMAANDFDFKRKVISRPFQRLLENYEKSVFNGPPENTRDFVAAASKALEKGDWKTCEDLVFAIQGWQHTQNVQATKTMLSRKIKEEALRTFLFTYNTHYDSLSLSGLIEMFDLPQNVIHSIVSKMMINEELHGAWDQPTGTIIMQQVEPTRLQYLAMQLAEKAANLVENNEKLLDGKTGGYTYNRDGQRRGDRDQRRGGSNYKQGGNTRERREGEERSNQSGGRGGKTSKTGRGGKGQSNRGSKGARRN